MSYNVEIPCRLRDFLSEEMTTPIELKDFSTWHHGNRYFLFWAILVDEAIWRQSIRRIQIELAEYLHEGYARQPHITLHAGQFCQDLTQCNEFILQQEENLIDLSLKPFRIEVTEINSFQTCPYLHVLDKSDTIARCRESLNQICKEERCSRYVPHITLGNYRSSYSTKKMADVFMALNERIVNNNKLSRALQVNNIALCAYDTHLIQGPITVIKDVPLG